MSLQQRRVACCLHSLSSRFHFDFVVGPNMPHYDFSVLSPYEFECLCRDLLQKKENVYIESFTEGKDGGVDLRFAKIKSKAHDFLFDEFEESENVVVQVKRYRNYQSLSYKLQKEADKVRNLNPARYYLMTSVGLTPGNKSEIQEIFTPYIKNREDIFGKDDLNNLLGQFPEIEKQYYKLWLSSTNVLETILNKRYSVWTQIEKDEIERSIRLYVPNPSFEHALEILQENRFVIISGMPGVGKTTLAQMLVNWLLTNGYAEFVSLEGDINAFAALNIEGKKQVFYFDDFLGSNILDKQHLIEDEGKLLKLIRFVRRTPDKLLILTTREYILQDAMQISDRLNTGNVEIGKCILNLAQYSDNVRAKILYNHLVAADLPDDYIDNLLLGRNYMGLVNHQNFNPRIIELFIANARWKECDPDDFVRTLTDLLDNPLLLWKNIFSNRPVNERYALLILLTMGQHVLLSEWEVAFCYFCKASQAELNLSADPTEWRKIIQSLQGTFIDVKRLGETELYYVDFVNHSVFDFLISYVRGDDSLYRLLIKGAYYIGQLCTIFVAWCEENDESEDNAVIKARGLEISENFYRLVNDKILQTLGDFRTPKQIVFNKHEIFTRTSTRLEELYEAAFCFPAVNKSFHFADIVFSPDLIKSDTCPYVIKCNLLPMLNWSYLNFTIDAILDIMEEQITVFGDYPWYIKLCADLNKKERFEKNEFANKFYVSLKNGVDSCSAYDEAEDLLGGLNLIRQRVPSFVRYEDFLYAETKAHDIMQEMEDPLEYDAWKEHMDEVYEFNRNIDEMFSSLKQ